MGEPGVGKTCALRALRHALPKEHYRLTYCHNVTLGRRDFYRQLCLALGLPRGVTAGAVFWAVSTHVEQLAQERLLPVFLVDEAHLLHQDTLDHLHILLNYGGYAQLGIMNRRFVGAERAADDRERSAFRVSAPSNRH